MAASNPSNLVTSPQAVSYIQGAVDAFVAGVTPIITAVGTIAADIAAVFVVIWGAQRLFEMFMGRAHEKRIDELVSGDREFDFELDDD